MDNNQFIPALTKIFFGLIYKDSKGLKFALNKISGIGKIDTQSIEIPFDFTDYYKCEMGTSLKRKFIIMGSAFSLYLNISRDR